MAKEGDVGITRTQEGKGTETEELGKSESLQHAMTALRRQYLLVSLAFKTSYWLQGPYFYELYTTKPSLQTLSLANTASESQRVASGIFVVYIVGYAASAVSSSFLGSLTDRRGRRFGVLLCGFLYFLSCISAHCSSVPWLLTGRVAGGMASVLMHSTFEAWLFGECALRNIPPTLAAVNIVAYHTAYSSALAILSGPVADAAFRFVGGVEGVFDAAALFVAFGTMLAWGNWCENYGDSSSPVGSSRAAPRVLPAPQPNGSTEDDTNDDGQVDSLAADFVKVWSALKGRPQLQLLCVVQVLFDCCLHVFIVAWYPMLKEANHENRALLNLPSSTVPAGMVFSGFMLCVMAGSMAFARLERCGVGAATQLSLITVLSASVMMFVRASSAPVFGASLVALVLAPCSLVMQPTSLMLWQTTMMEFLSSYGSLTLVFFVFEFAAGAYLPCAAALRATLVPPHLRASVASWIKLPQHLLTIFLLFQSTGTKTLFPAIAVIALFVSALLALVLSCRMRASGEKKTS